LAVWGVALLFGAILLGATADTAITATADTAATVAAVTQDHAAAQSPAAADGAETVAVTQAEASAAAETARKYSVISAFILAASQLIAGAGAYWAAGMGGQHRDEGRVFARFGRWI
jgi:hypothetical protein